MERLKTKYKGFVLYQAGLLNFPRNFSRDSILSAILAADPDMLQNQLSFCALRQGMKKNPYNGEEPGKIFHEYPAVKVRGLSAEFNACDTTALYLIGHESYQKLTNDKSLVKDHKENIERAVNYIISHQKNNLFLDLFAEDPEFCGAKRFALKVTYWKDSEILDREDGEPVYPVVYTLAHIQNMCGLRSAAKLLNSTDLKKTAEKMKEKLKELYDLNLGCFYIAIDRKGPICGISSDSLHALFYLESEDLPTKQLEEIIESAKLLETPLGYRTLSPELSHKLRDGYHARTLWPFEQAVIHSGARKFGLEHIVKVSSRIIKWLDTNPEIFILDNKEIKKGGCDTQLWTIAAKKYFKIV